MPRRGFSWPPFGCLSDEKFNDVRLTLGPDRAARPLNRFLWHHDRVRGTQEIGFNLEGEKDMTSQFKLEGTVGPNNDVEPRDARKVKQALLRLGDLENADVASLDFVDGPTLDGLKAFQKRNGLVADGIVKPGGPTEGVIAVVLAEQGKGTARKAEGTRDPVVKPAVLAQSQKPAGAAAQQPGGATISWPVKKQTIKSGFGKRKRPLPGASDMHRAIDFKAPLGTAIHSTQDGKVLTIGNEPGSGNFVLIQNDDGSMSGYAHTGAISTLRQGQRVRSGEKIGVSNGTGRIKGPHLHYTYRPGTQAQPAVRSSPKGNPMKTQFKGMKPMP